MFLCAVTPSMHLVCSMYVRISWYAVKVASPSVVPCDVGSVLFPDCPVQLADISSWWHCGGVLENYSLQWIYVWLCPYMSLCNKDTVAPSLHQAECLKWQHERQQFLCDVKQFWEGRMPLEVLTDRYSPVKEIVEKNRLVCPYFLRLHVYTQCCVCAVLPPVVPPGTYLAVARPIWFKLL